jgi:hypothetical protein
MRGDDLWREGAVGRLAGCAGAVGLRRRGILKDGKKFFEGAFLFDLFL